MRTAKLFVSACALLCLSLVATAEEHLEEVVVTATVPDSRDDVDQVDLEQFTGFATRVERDAFSQQMSTVSDVLDRTQGVQVRQIGGYGGFSTVSMRGSSGKQVNVYLDGMLINSAQSGSSNLTLVPASILDRIDIYPDFTPVQLSNANLGGAVNIVTLDVFKPLREISVAQGSFGRERYALTIADLVGDWNFLMSADAESADNDYEVLNNQATYFNPDDDVIEDQNNAAFDQKALLLKMGTQWGRNQKLEFLVNWSGTDKQVPSVDNNLENKATMDTDFRSLQVKYNRDYGAVRGSHRLYASATEQRYDDRFGTVGIGNENLRTDESSRGLANVFALDWLDQLAVLNIEYREEAIQQQNLTRNTEALDNQRKQWLAGLQDDLYFLHDALALSLAVRYFHADDSVDIAPGQSQVFGNAVYSDVSDHGTNPSLGVSYALVADFKLKANLAQQSRLPTLQERFGVTGQMVGNPELKIETSTNWDAGFEWQHNAINVTASYFEKALDDGIVLVYDSRAVAKAENISEATIAGVSLDSRWKALQWLEFTAGGTWLDTENLSGLPDQQGKKLPGIYHQSVNAAAETSWQQWLLRVLYQYDDELYYNFSNSLDPISRELVDLQLRWTLDRLSVQLNANNILDERYEQYNRFLAPGRSFDINLTFNW